MMDKFKNQEALQKAYESLEKEFTRRSQRLRELQGKVEQGTLIDLPCKVGDTVYLVHRDRLIIECWLLTQFSIEESGIWLHIRNAKLLSTVIHSKSRGVCFTREEAEKRLEELKK